MFQRLLSWFVWHLVEWQSEDSLTPIVPLVGREKIIEDFSENFLKVRDEILSNSDKATPIEGDLYFGSDITSDGKWKKIYLKWYAKPEESLNITFPSLMGILDRNPEIRLAMISKLEPGAVIKPHTGVYRGSVRVHVGIKTPNDPNCFIQIDKYRYSWKDGEIIGFDDTYAHGVINNTDQERVVLFLDVDRRMKSRWSQYIINFISTRVASLTNRS